MAQPFVGEIRLFAGNFEPSGWMFCNGQLLAVSENETLFTLIGTTYGGDGNTTFGLPDLRSRVPIHMGAASSGTNYQLGIAGGQEQVTLTINQIPQHTHALFVSTDAGTEISANNNVLGGQQTAKTFRPGTASGALAPASMSAVGGSQPHTNLQPYLCFNYIISLFGIFPSQT